MNHSRVKSNRRYRIDKVSRGFLGVRSMGLFAPLSYLRTEEDWGVGDLDALMMWVELRRKPVCLSFRCYRSISPRMTTLPTATSVRSYSIPFTSG